MKIIALLLTCLALCACKENPPPTQKHQERPLNAKESFFRVWAEVIARTEAINSRARELTQEKGLHPGDTLSPTLLQITGVEGTSPAEPEKPMDLLLEATISGETIPFWIHIGPKVPTMKETYAVAVTINPETREPVFYPRTKETEAKIALATITLKTTSIENAIQRRKEEMQRKTPPPPKTP